MLHNPLNNDRSPQEIFKSLLELGSHESKGEKINWDQVTIREYVGLITRYTLRKWYPGIGSRASTGHEPQI